MCGHGSQLSYGVCVAAVDEPTAGLWCESRMSLGLVLFRAGRCKLSCRGSAGSLSAVLLVTPNYFSSHSSY